MSHTEPSNGYLHTEIMWLKHDLAAARADAERLREAAKAALPLLLSYPAGGVVREIGEMVRSAIASGPTKEESK